MSTADELPLEKSKRRRRRLTGYGAVTLGAVALVFLIALAVLVVVVSLAQDAPPKRFVGGWFLEPGAKVAVVPAELVRIVDGDTGVYRLADGTLEKVRLIGIEAPESMLVSDRYTLGAAAAARRLAGSDPQVYLEIGVNERDRFGQLLAYVWLEKPKARPSAAEVRDKMLNAKMVAEGYAREFATVPGRVYANDRYTPLFVEAASEARRLHKGLWDPEFANAAGPPPESWTARASVEPTSITSPYVGNRTTLKLHRGSCENAAKMRVENRVPFDSREAAVASRFVPCGICEP